jgi:PST family polysaccharide transporter
MGVSLLVGIWVARYLGPDQFGLLNFALAFVGLFAALPSLGLQGIVVRDIVRYPNCAQVTLGTAALLQMISGPVAYLLLLVAIMYLRPDDALARSVVCILGSMMLIEATKIAVYWFESQIQSRYTVWVQSSTLLAFALIKIILIMQGSSLTAFVWVTLAELATASLMLLIVMNKHGPSLTSLRFTFERAKTLLTDSWPLIFSAISVTIYMKIDQIMIGQMMGDEAVGIYTAASRISELWYFIPMAIAASVFPTILEAKKKSEDLYYAHLQKLYNLMVVISLAVAVPMTFVSTELVKFLYGEAYLDAGPILAIHIWAAIFVFLGVASGQWFIAENKQLLNLERTAIGAVVNVILNLWLIPIYGSIGAAIATVISQAMASWLYDVVQSKTRKMFLMKAKAMNPVNWIRIF